LADTLSRDPAELEEGDEPATADAEGLICFLEGEVLPWFEARKKELANRSLIREQAFGESLDPDKLERLGRYEVDDCVANSLVRGSNQSRLLTEPQCTASSSAYFVSEISYEGK
jgi:hypothetical protein